MSQELDIFRVGSSVKKHLKTMGTIIIVSVGAAVLGAYTFLPVKYKSFSVIAIPSRYFQQPVVEDIIPSSGDPSENRALREGLLKSSLGRESLESLRKKFNLFPGLESGHEKEYEIAMQKFQAGIEILSLGATSFQIGYIGSTSQQTFEIASEIQKLVIEKLIFVRHQKLIDLRDNLLGRVDNLSFNVKGAADPISSSRPEVIQSELSQVQGILASLNSRFSSEHPLVKSYKQRESLLLQWLKNKKVQPKAGKEKVEGLSSANLGDMDRYSDLLKRVDRLNIVLEYEAKNPESLVDLTTPAIKPLAPISPNYSLVILWGFLGGMFFAMIYVAVRRMSELAVSPTAAWATNHRIIYLGKIPDLRRQIKFKSKIPREKENSTHKE